MCKKCTSAAAEPQLERNACFPRRDNANLATQRCGISSLAAEAAEALASEAGAAGLIVIIIIIIVVVVRRWARRTTRRATRTTLALRWATLALCRRTGGLRRRAGGLGRTNRSLSLGGKSWATRSLALGKSGESLWRALGEALRRAFRLARADGAGGLGSGSGDCWVSWSATLRKESATLRTGLRGGNRGGRDDGRGLGRGGSRGSGRLGRRGLGRGEGGESEDCETHTGWIERVTVKPKWVLGCSRTRRSALYIYPKLCHGRGSGSERM
jgi:hypothetical protein